MTAICTHVYIHVPPGSSTPSQLSSAGAESARADFTSTASLCGSTIAGSVFISTQGTRFVCYLSAYTYHGSGTSHVCSPWIMAQVHEIFKPLRSAQSPRNTKRIGSRLSYAVFVKANSEQPTAQVQATCNRNSPSACRIVVHVTQMRLHLDKLTDIDSSNKTCKVTLKVPSSQEQQLVRVSGLLNQLTNHRHHPRPQQQAWGSACRSGPSRDS